MNTEEKQILLKDLCARLPYRVIVHVEGSVGGNYLHGDSTLVGVHNGVIHVENASAYGNYEGLPLTIDIKPYLRPMSSMTDEEKEEFENLVFKYNFGDIQFPIENTIMYWDSFEEVLDYLISHHFDYRDLIEKGLAIEAPENMYKTE